MIDSAVFVTHPTQSRVFFFFFLILVDLANSIPQTVKEAVREMDVDGGS